MACETACPQCRQTISYQAEHAGKLATCCYCQSQFVLPATPAPAPANAAPAPRSAPAPPAPPAPAAPAFPTVYEPLRRPVPGGGLATLALVVLDWRLEHYLTPWIMRVLWVLAAVFTTLSILLYTTTTLAFDLASVSSSPPTRTATSGRVTINERVDFDDRSFDGLPERSWFSLASWIFNERWQVRTPVKIGVFGFVSLLSLLWFRVVCESVVVFFNMANSLKTIAAQTAPAKS